MKKAFISSHLFYYISFLLFALFLGFVSYHNRMGSMDDLFFYLQSKQHGVIQSLFEFDFNTRFFSFFVFNAVFSCVDHYETFPIIIFLYHSIFFILFVLSIGFFLSNLACALNLSITKHQRITLSFTLFMVLFFGSPQLIDNWFWVVASTVYTLPLIFIFFGFGKLIEKNSNWASRVLLFLCFLFVGGCLETLAITVVFILAILFFLSYKNSNFKYLRVRLLCCILAAILFGVINILRGVNSARVDLEQSYYSDYVGFSDFSMSFFGYNKVFVWIGFLIFFLIGNSLKRYPMNKNQWIKLLLWNVFIVFSVLIITVIPLFYVFHDWGPARAWIPFHFIVYLTLSFWIFVFGNRMRISFDTTIMNRGVGIVLLILFVSLFFRQKDQIISFSKTHDERILELISLRNRGYQGVYYFKPLPNPAYGVGFQIEEDSLASKNQHLKKALKLNFNIVLEP